jgi:tripartite ATP-independent transporter DctM subunit
MTAMLIHHMAPIMFASLVVFLLLGYPVAFSLAANGLIFGLIGIELGLFRPDFLQALPERIYGIMSNDVLLAIPFFTFMGLILERSGMAEDLLDTVGQLFGTIRGGLAYAVIFVGALLAATTGVVAASVISMGLISLPIMLRYGYDRRVASGVIAASGTLAQIIPPSLVLIVMADQLGRSVGDMYEGAFLPGLLLAGLYAAYVLLVSMLFPKFVPGLPLETIGYLEPNGARGVWQLGVLVLFSGIVAYCLMRQTNVRPGADFVVLTMSVGVLVSFLSAVFHRFFGARLIYVTVLLLALFAGAWYYLDNHNHENWALLMAAFAFVPVIDILVLWLPAAVYLGLEGRWGEALGLAGLGTLLVRTVENFLYPILVRDRLKVPSVGIFISLLGGLLVFGWSGLVLGPVVLTTTAVLLELCAKRLAEPRPPVRNALNGVAE